MMKTERAIILAAGMGVRLHSVVDDRPKGLIDVAGEPLVGRSVRLLREAGVTHITIVAGYRAGDYRQFAAGHADLEVVMNRDFATTGSMASLAIALETTGADVLVLESDIAYEARALSTILRAAAPDSTLVSGPTGAGDEVWVSAPDGRLQSMSKVAGELPTVDGELVGITRLSAAAARAMRDAFGRFVETRGHGRMDYETGALVEIGRRIAISALLVSDLRWGEIDDERQLARVVQLFSNRDAPGNQRSSDRRTSATARGFGRSP